MNYGEFGGQYVPQDLKEKLQEIEKEFKKFIWQRKKTMLLFSATKREGLLWKLK